MRINTVFFDLDDTLINDSWAQKKGLYQVKMKYFGRLNPRRFEKLWFEKTEEKWLLFEQGKLTFKEQRIERVKAVWEVLGKKIDDEEANKVVSDYLNQYENNWIAFPKVLPTIKRLYKEQVTIGILTNGTKEQQVRKMKAIGIYPYFREEMIVTPDDTDCFKPDEKMFEYAEKISNSQPSEMLMVGNSEKLDIVPALQKGWQAFLVNHFDKNAKNDLREILKLVEI
jgi:putative hydrolase of the HAD superfamily